MSIEKRRKGYCVRWRDSSGTPKSKQVSLYRDAVTLDGEMKRKKAMGELITHEKGTIKLCDFWDVWLANYGCVHLTPRSVDTYTRLYTKHILPSIGGSQLRNLTREHVTSLTSRLTKTLAPGSVRKCLAILQGVLQRAVEWGYIPANPVVGTKKPRLVQRSGRALSPTEVEAICKELDLRSATVVRVLAGTGLRPGEMRALTWGDFHEFHILVERAVSANVVGPTKTNSKRTVELLGALVPVLKEWRLYTGNPYAGAYVFPGRDGKVWTDQGWRMWQRDTFTPAAARAGLKGVVPYDLRHTAASRWIASGRDIYWIARQLGHSPTMTLTTYAHLFESNYQGGSDGVANNMAQGVQAGKGPLAPPGNWRHGSDNALA